jgi:DNA repair photolyase
MRFKRLAEGAQWTDEVLNQTAVNRGYGKRKGNNMFPTTHDITPANVDAALVVLKKLLGAGNQVLIVSKPHLDCVQRLCTELNEWWGQILFRFTIGSMNEETLAFWEPGAPSFAERFSALKHAHKEGFTTSVSMEPLLELHEDAVVWTVDNLAEHVDDAVWIGKANRLVERLKRNGHWSPETMQAAMALQASQSDERIRALHLRLGSHPKVKWKESIKKVVGIEVPTEVGLDI